MSQRKLRDSIPAAGSFVSLPEAFPGADKGVVLAPKIELQVARFKDAKHPLKFDQVMYSHRILVDLEAVDAASFDSEKLIKDCEAFLAVAKLQPEKLRSILAAFAEDAPHQKMLDAAQLVSKLGLAEEELSRKGGGFLWLLVVVAAVALSGCKECAHTRGSTRQAQ